MKPPHHMCLGCGIILTDQGRPPESCPYCGDPEFKYLGYAGEYDPDEYHIDVKLRKLKLLK